MAAREFHVNLTNSSFPHNFDELGSTVIYASPFEQNRAISGGFSGQDAEQSAGICQAYFMQNVLPTSRGYSSVSFLETLPPIPGLRGVPEDAYILRGESSASAVFVPTTDRQYIFDPTVGSWQEFSVGTLAPSPPTVAFVKQRSSVFYPNIGCFEYDFTAREFKSVSFEGLNVGNILGICPAGSVLVAWDSTTVYWSSVLDPLDFTPSLSTGAGSTSVLAVRGEIITCLSMGENFVIYTATNAVGARQSGNVQLPFTFAEISGSEGIESAQHVAYDTNQGVHITWTASGFQQVSLEQAGYIWPEFSDGIIRAIYSDYDENFNRPVLRRVARLELKLNFIGNRWVGVSVKDAADASGSYSFAMIYDTSLQRWGRLDVLHKDLVEFVGPNISRSLTYAELAEEYPTYADMVNIPYQQFAEQVVISSPRSGLNFGVALANGSIFRAALYQTGLSEETTSGISAAPPRIILGKFKIFRTQGAMLHGFKAQRLEEGVGIRAHLHSYTGELVGHKVGFVENNKHAGHFLGRANADSFSLEFTGKFHLTDLVCNAANAGSRNQRGVALLEEVLCLQTDAGECVKVTQDGVEYCVVVGGDPSSVGNVGSKLELQALFDYGLTLEEEQYSEETWQVFAAAMLVALGVLETPGATQVVIDGAYVELEAGISQLEYSIPVPTYIFPVYHSATGRPTYSVGTFDQFGVELYYDQLNNSTLFNAIYGPVYDVYLMSRFSTQSVTGGLRTITVDGSGKIDVIREERSLTGPMDFSEELDLFFTATGSGVSGGKLSDVCAGDYSKLEVIYTTSRSINAVALDPLGRHLCVGISASPISSPGGMVIDLATGVAHGVGERTAYAAACTERFIAFGRQDQSGSRHVQIFSATTYENLNAPVAPGITSGYVADNLYWADENTLLCTLRFVSNLTATRFTAFDYTGDGFTARQVVALPARTSSDSNSMKFFRLAGDPPEIVCLTGNINRIMRINYMTGEFLDDVIIEQPGTFIYGPGVKLPKVTPPDPEPSLPTEIGQAFGGGYYIGDITVADGGPDDGTYAVIMAGPEADANLAWKNPRSITPGTDSSTNGLANTLAMQADDPVAHQAGMYCLSYTNGDFSGGYMPAQDELNLVWLNRSLLAELVMGDRSYWTSTQYSADTAWGQDFAAGGQGTVLKSSTRYVRPVRRIRKS